MASAARPPMVLATASAPAAARTPGTSWSAGHPARAWARGNPSCVRVRTRRRSVATAPAPAASVSTAAATVPPPRSSAATCSSAPGRPAVNAPLAAGTSEDQRGRPCGQHPEDSEPGEDRGQRGGEERDRGSRDAPVLDGFFRRPWHVGVAQRDDQPGSQAFRHPPPRPRTERPCSVRDRGAATRGDQPRTREWPHDHEHEGQHGRSHSGWRCPSGRRHAPRRARAAS